MGALETVGAEVDHDRLARHRTQRIDDIDLPGADDAFVLVLGALQQRIILVLRQFGKAGAPADIDEDGEEPAIARGRQHALGVFDGVVLLDLPAEILALILPRVAHAVLPMQHQERGFRRHPSGHCCFLPASISPKAIWRCAVAKPQSEAKPEVCGFAGELEETKQAIGRSARA